MSVVAFDVSDAWFGDDQSTMLHHLTPSGVVDVPLQTSARDLDGSGPTDIFLLDTNGVISHSTGAAFVAMTPPEARLSGMAGRLRAFAANDVYAFGIEVLMHYDGTTWTSIPAIPSGARVHDVFATGPNDVFVAFDGATIHFDGTTWSPVTVGTLFGIEALAGDAGTVVMLDGNAVSHRVVRITPW
jgi:hypothetical protein